MLQACWLANAGPNDHKYATGIIQQSHRADKWLDLDTFLGMKVNSKGVGAHSHSLRSLGLIWALPMCILLNIFSYYFKWKWHFFVEIYFLHSHLSGQGIVCKRSYLRITDRLEPVSVPVTFVPVTVCTLPPHLSVGACHRRRRMAVEDHLGCPLSAILRNRKWYVRMSRYVLDLCFKRCCVMPKFCPYTCPFMSHGYNSNKFQDIFKSIKCYGAFVELLSKWLPYNKFLIGALPKNVISDFIKI